MAIETELPYAHSLDNLATEILSAAEPWSDEEYFDSTHAIQRALDSISRHPYDQLQIRDDPETYTLVVISAFRNDLQGKETVAWLLKSKERIVEPLFRTLDEDHKRQVLYGVVQNEINIRSAQLDIDERKEHFGGEIDEDSHNQTVSKISTLRSLKRKIRERVKPTPTPEQE